MLVAKPVFWARVFIHSSCLPSQSPPLWQERGDPSPSLLITFSHLSLSLSLSLSSHFSSSSSPELNRGVASHLRRTREEMEKRKSHLGAILPARADDASVEEDGAAEGGGGGRGKMIKASSSSPLGRPSSLSLSLSLSLSASRWKEGKRQKSSRR